MCCVAGREEAEGAAKVLQRLWSDHHHQEGRHPLSAQRIGSHATDGEGIRHASIAVFRYENSLSLSLFLPSLCYCFFHQL